MEWWRGYSEFKHHASAEVIGGTFSYMLCGNVTIANEQIALTAAD